MSPTSAETLADARPDAVAARASSASAPRVALLTNFVPPYRRPLYRALAARLGALRVLVSTEMEPNRSWPVDWRGLDVAKMRGITLERRARHPHAFEEPLYVHLPFSTPIDLWRARPDVVVSGQLGLASLWAALFCMLRRKTALVLWLTVSETSELGRGSVRRHLRRWLAARADAVLVNGASGRRYVRGLGVDDARIFEAPYTADVEAFAAHAESPERRPRRWLYVGSGEARKGLGPFLEQLASWARANRESSIDLCVAGTRADEVPELPHTFPPNLSIEWLGRVDYERLPEVYGRCGVFVFPTLADEWGLVVNEALAAGLPVLGSVHSQAVEELVEDGVTGWTFRPESADETRAAIARLVAVDPPTLSRMRARCRERVAGLGFDAVAERMRAAIAFAARSRQG